MESIFSDIGLPPEQENTFNLRAQHSETALRTLRSSLIKSPRVASMSAITIFSVGSYARREASEFSDIDLFFVVNGSERNDATPRISTIQFFSDVIGIVDQQGFPELSNDGEYLKLLYIDDILESLGGRLDDYHNHFTARMLMLLECTPVFNDQLNKEIIVKIINAYFRDYDHHTDDFRPTFLVNDIMRFWKTLCLNYEYRRNQSEEAGKVKQKIKNFKLKFSRLLTCFSTIALLASYDVPVTSEIVLDIVSKTPAERLRIVGQQHPSAIDEVKKAMSLYAWFLKVIHVPKNELEEYFSCESSRLEAFGKANEFGDIVYRIINIVSANKPHMRHIMV